MFMCSCAQMFH